MGRTCTVCFHPQRAEIDLALLMHSASYRVIARRFGLVMHSLQRHEENHLRTSLQQLMEETGMDIARYVMERMLALDQRNERALVRIEQSGDDRAVLVGDDLAGRHLARLWAMGPGNESPESRRIREQQERLDKKAEEIRRIAQRHQSAPLSPAQIAAADQVAREIEDAQTPEGRERLLRWTQ